MAAARAAIRMTGQRRALSFFGRRSVRLPAAVPRAAASVPLGPFAARSYATGERDTDKRAIDAYQEDDHPYRRSHLCGSLAGCKEGDEVSLWGWVAKKRPSGNKLMFMTLRDHSGTVQVVLNAGHTHLSGGTAEAESLPHELLHINHESIVWVRGVVKQRPAKDLREGADAQELVVEEARLLNTSVPTLPVLLPELELKSQIGNKQEAGSSTVQREEQRLRWRVPYLRTDGMQARLRTRAKVLSVMRNHLDGNRFVEVDTPTLFRRTSEGAREFLVPSSADKGLFYTLVQSPQQYKQMLMAGGMDRYYQVAKCYRDEALRSDRQPEFTQLDLEMSCVSQEELFGLMEDLLRKVWKETLAIDLPKPFPRMRFEEAMARYGIDKPDTRYGMELADVTGTLAASVQAGHRVEAQVLRAAVDEGRHVVGLVVEGMAEAASKKEVEKFQKEAKRVGAKGVTTALVKEDGEWKSAVAKHLSREAMASVNEKMGAKAGDLILLFSEETLLRTQQMAGFLRIFAAKMMQSKGLLEIPADQFNFLWVVDFPLFTEYDEVVEGPHQGNKLCSAFEATHHPFTSPVPEDMSLLLEKDADGKPQYAAIRGQHYDVVANGMELGGGSIRIHDAAVQMKVFTDVLGLEEAVVQDQFHHLLESLTLGCPPHGGIALGLDRLLAMISGVTSIRDVIAFPKAQSGRELLTGAPAPIPTAELREFGLSVLPKEEPGVQ